MGVDIRVGFHIPTRFCNIWPQNVSIDIDWLKPKEPLSMNTKANQSWLDLGIYLLISPSPPQFAINTEITAITYISRGFAQVAIRVLVFVSLSISLELLSRDV